MRKTIVGLHLQQLKAYFEFCFEIPNLWDVIKFSGKTCFVTNIRKLKRIIERYIFERWIVYIFPEEAGIAVLIFFFLVCITSLSESCFPDWGSNWCPQQWEAWGLNCWTTRSPCINFTSSVHSSTIACFICVFYSLMFLFPHQEFISQEGLYCALVFYIILTPGT